MPKYTVDEAPPSLDIEDDEVFTAELVSIAERDREVKRGERKGEKYKVLNWKFVIQDDGGEFDDRPIWGDISPDLNDHPNNKFRAWSAAVLGGALPVGYDLDTDDLVGQTVKIVVGRREYEKDGDNLVYNFVKDILPNRAVGAGVSASSNVDDYGEEPF